MGKYINEKVVNDKNKRNENQISDMILDLKEENDDLKERLSYLEELINKNNS